MEPREHRVRPVRRALLELLVRLDRRAPKVRQALLAL